jgi:hypothetical protein
MSRLRSRCPRGDRTRFAFRPSQLVPLGCMAFIVLSSTNVAARIPVRPHLSLDPGGIAARFDPPPPEAHPCPIGTCQTGYQLIVFHAVGRVTVTWRLHLQLVDPAGTPDPNTSESGAAVDVGCTNDGVGTNKPDVQTLPPSDHLHYGHFIWHHPDGPDSNPAGLYHCNHTDQGPHGHQGLFTVKVRDSRGETCTDSYKGTNSGWSHDQGEKAHCTFARSR